MSPGLQIVPKEQILSPHLCILIFGENGVGKTHLAATFMNAIPGKMLFLNWYGNPETLLKFPIDKYDIVEGPSTYNGTQTIWSDPLLDQYDAICIDNITGVYRDFITDVVKSFPNGLGKDGPNKSGGRGHESPTLGDYGLASERLRLFCTAARNRRAKQHVICIAHQRLDKDDISGEIHGFPSVPGQVPAHLLSLFTESIYMKEDPGGRRYACYDKVSFFKGASRLLPEPRYEIAKVSNPVLDPRSNIPIVGSMNSLAVMYKSVLNANK